jgi:hypothetical protein
LLHNKLLFEKKKLKDNFFGCFYEAGDEHAHADGAENDARSAYDTIDGDSPAPNPCPSGKNRTGA